MFELERSVVRSWQSNILKKLPRILTEAVASFITYPKLSASSSKPHTRSINNLFNVFLNLVLSKLKISEKFFQGPKFGEPRRKISLLVLVNVLRVRNIDH